MEKSYLDMTDDEIMDCLHDELPQEPGLEIYEHEPSGIIFEVTYVHYEGANFCGMNWDILERPNPNEEMIKRDEYSSEEKEQEPVVNDEQPNPFLIETTFSHLLGCLRFIRRINQ